MNPLVLVIQKIIKKRALAVLTCIVLVIGAIVAVGVLLTPIVIKELTHMGNLLSELLKDSAIKQRAMSILPQDLWQYLQDFATKQNVQNFFSVKSLSSIFGTASQKALPELMGLFSNTISLILGIVGLAVILLYLIFILLDYEVLMAQWKNLIPSNQRGFVIELIEDFTDAMNRYFRAQALIACIIATIYAIGFSIIGLPMGILLGIFIGILCMIPYLQILGVIPAVFLALMYSLETGHSFNLTLLYVGIVFLVVELVQDVILTPRIMGKVIGLNPAIILLSISIWGKLLGILGLLIALPLTYFLLSYYKRFIAKTSTEIPEKPEQSS
jgi:predicted PurR-regulated permease PerM